MAELIDYRVSYGECVGYCTSTLTINGSEIELVQTSNAGEPPLHFRGSIDENLADRIRDSVAKVDVEQLDSIYGDPDAHDEGAVTIRLAGDGGVTEHSYSRGRPPDHLAALDALIGPIVLHWIDGDPPQGVRFNDVP
jgi:hypothetical protein